MNYKITQQQRAAAVPAAAAGAATAAPAAMESGSSPSCGVPSLGGSGGGELEPELGIHRPLFAQPSPGAAPAMLYPPSSREAPKAVPP